MDQREKIVQIAKGQIGYKEGRNNDTKFGEWYGMNHNPWCAMFVSWCAAQAKVKKDVILKFAYVPYGVDFFKKQGRWRDKKYTPKAGDIIFFGDEAHVGIVEVVVNDYIYTIEGNTSSGGNSSNGDGVYRRTRRLDNPWIMGYGVPNYEDDIMEVKKIVCNVNGANSELATIVYKDENYIRLRDLADVDKTDKFEVEWNEAERKVFIKTK